MSYLFTSPLSFFPFLFIFIFLFFSFSFDFLFGFDFLFPFFNLFPLFLLFRTLRRISFCLIFFSFLTRVFFVFFCRLCGFRRIRLRMRNSVFLGNWIGFCLNDKILIYLFRLFLLHFVISTYLFNPKHMQK